MGHEFYPIPIDVGSLHPKRTNVCHLGDGVDAVVLVRGDRLQIFRDICPHMGAPMSAGEYCAKKGTLACPWHGYVYNVDTGGFIQNPNDEIFAALKGLYTSYKPEKTPKYRLHPLAYEIKDGKAYVRRGGSS